MGSSSMSGLYRTAAPRPVGLERYCGMPAGSGIGTFQLKRQPTLVNDSLLAETVPSVSIRKKTALPGDQDLPANIMVH